MGSIVPGVGAVPGAGRGRADPGDGSWGVGRRGQPGLWESESKNPRKETRKRNGKDPSGRLRGREEGVDE